MEHIPKEISQTEIEVQLDSTHDFALPKNNLSESQSQAEIYNPDQVPPDFTAAANHGKAFRIHKSKTIQCHKNLSKICQCCKLSSDAEQLPFSCDLNSFYSVGTYYLGGGYALYFTFLKYCVVLLCLLFSISGLYNLITNISGDDCDESDDSNSFCVKDFLTVITIVNKRSNSKQLTTNLALNLASAVVITVFMHIFRYKMRKISASVYQKNTTPSDYTLKLTRIPAEVSDAEIKNWLESFSTENFPIKCEKIIRTYNLEEIRRIELKKEALKQKYQNVKGTTLQAFFQMELLKLQTEINKKLRNNNYEYTHSVYAVFSDAVVASVLLRMLKPADPSCLQRLNPFHKALLNMGQHKINIKRAPEPTDVWWKNLGHDNKGKRRSRMVTTFSTSLTLAVGFGLILLVYWIQKELREKFTGHTDVTRILGFIGSLLICLINIVLAATIKRFVKYEKHGTRGGFLTAVAEKQTIALLINTAFISLIVEIILSESYTVSNGILTNVYKLDLYRKGGLIENMFFVFLINSFYVPVLDLLNPVHFWKRYKQKKASEMGDSIVMTQQTANTLFEGPQLEISNKYALVIKTMILTSFYAPGMPLVTFISLVGLIFSYWSEKYLFLRRNALPPTLSDWLNNSMVEYLNWAVVAFALGNIMFMATLINTDGELAFSSNDKIIAFVTLGIAAVNILLPMKSLNMNLFKLNCGEKKSVESYQEARQYFHTDYDLENPMTRHKALDTLIRKIHKNRSKRSLSKLDPDLKLKIENSIMSNYLCKTDFFQGSKETARSERSARRGE